jgi:hypothetical protein
MQIVVFHLPRGANRSDRSDLQAISTPNTKVMYPTRKMAILVSVVFYHTRFCTRTWKRYHRQPSTLVRQYTMKGCALCRYEYNLL